MPDVIFKVSADVAQALQGFLQLAKTQTSIEGSTAKAVESMRKMDREVQRSANNARAAAREFDRLKSSRDVRFVEPARVRGWDTSDTQGDVWRARYLKAQDIRASRRQVRDQELAALEATAAATVAAELAAAKKVAESKRELSRTIEHQIQLNNTELRAAKLQKSRRDSSQFITGAAGLIGAGVYGLASYAQSYAEGIDRVGSAGTGFEHDIRGLLSLHGFKGNDRVRQRVLSTSGAYGRSASEVTQALYELENNAGNLDPSTKSRLFSAGANMTSTSGGELNSNVTALTKVWQVYGKELGSVAVAQAKVQKTADESAASIKDVAEMIPDILPAAKAFGYSFDEVAAAITTATQLGGSTEKTFTALRNVFLMMSDAEKEGIHLTGSLTDKLKELSKTDPEILKKVFGERTVTTLMSLAENTDRVASNIERMKRVTAGDALNKTLAMLGDSRIRDANLRESLSTNLGNVDIFRAQDATTRNKDLEYKMREVGYEQSVPQWVKSSPFGGVVKWANIAAGDSSWNGRDWMRLGVEQVINQKFDAGDAQGRLEANMLQLKYGAYTGTQYRNRKGKTVATDDSDVDRYATLLRAGHQLSSGQYAQFRTLEEQDPTGEAARRYLANLDETAKKLHRAAVNLEAATANIAQASTNRVGRTRNVNN